VPYVNETLTFYCLLAREFLIFMIIWTRILRLKQFFLWNQSTRTFLFRNVLNGHTNLQLKQKEGIIALIKLSISCTHFSCRKYVRKCFKRHEVLATILSCGSWRKVLVSRHICVYAQVHQRVVLLQVQYKWYSIVFSIIYESHAPSDKELYFFLKPHCKWVYRCSRSIAKPRMCCQNCMRTGNCRVDVFVYMWRWCFGHLTIFSKTQKVEEMHSVFFSCFCENLLAFQSIRNNKALLYFALFIK
jgi:hypothetical protein